jgi:hypothetical protein
MSSDSSKVNANNKRSVPAISSGSPERRQRATSRQTSNALRFNKHDLIFYFQRGSPKMVVPGIVLDTWSSGSTMMVSIRYWYRKDIETGAWSIYPRTNQDLLVMKMDSALLHARPPEAGKIMLVPQIMNGKYQNIASWYDKHKRACMDLEKEGRRKKEEAEIKARMA